MNQNPAQPDRARDLSRSITRWRPGLREGRIGQVDLARASATTRCSTTHRRRSSGCRRTAEHQWVNYYTLDIGYSFIVEAARLAFPTLPDNHLRALALQLVADAALVVFVFFLFSQWNLGLGLLAAYLYASNGVFYDLVSFAYYYYWDIPLTFVVLGALLLAYRRPAEATRWLTLAGARSRLRRVAARIVVAALAVPVRGRGVHAGAAQKAARRRSSRSRWSRRRRSSARRVARGQLTFTTRAVWHVALVGLGYYPNPYGLEAKDESDLQADQTEVRRRVQVRGLLGARSGGEEGVLLDLAEGSRFRDPVVLRTAEGIGRGQHADERAVVPVRLERDLPDPVPARPRRDDDPRRRQAAARRSRRPAPMSSTSS